MLILVLLIFADFQLILTSSKHIPTRIFFTKLNERCDRRLHLNLLVIIIIIIIAYSVTDLPREFKDKVQLANISRIMKLSKKSKIQQTALFITNSSCRKVPVSFHKSYPLHFVLGLPN